MQRLKSDQRVIDARTRHASRARFVRALALAGIACGASIAAGGIAQPRDPKAAPAPEVSRASAARFTDETPDAMVDAAKARALAAGAPEHQVVAAVVTISALADRASRDRASRAL